MTNVIKDNNGIPVVAGASSTDGSTPTLLKVSATTHGIMVDDASTGSDLGSENAKRDDNGYPMIMGVSEADGITPVPIYIKPTGGKLFVDSN